MINNYPRPVVSVLLASHQMNNFLLISINSILQQTLEDIELIFVANGVDCVEISNYVKINVVDPRLVILTSPVAQLAHSLNIALSASRADLVARMDADDISVLDRLQSQVDYIKKNELDMVGGDLECIDILGEKIGKRIYPKGKSINRILPFSNPFAHNTILIKKEILLLARGYNSGFNTEDYDLWLRLKRQDVRWDNMSKVLVLYRIHPNSTQRRLLGYAEATGLVVREFLITKNPIFIIASAFHCLKSFIRPTRK